MNKEQIRVLYIDDEVNNLNSFKALFRKDFEIFTAESAEEGRLILSQSKIHVIICDQRMPGMTGVEFFESILLIYPHPIRILLTGYTDIQAVVEAINRGQIYRFIDKPWDEQVITVAIKNAFEIYHTKFLLREQNIDLQKAYEELDKFVYSASHDLRAPLASILGLIKVAKTEDEKTAYSYFDLLEKTVNKMDTFVQNIIKYYRTTRLDIQLSFINFDQLINSVWADLKDGELAKNIIFTSNISEPIHIRTDESRVRIILTNILVNAIRFQDETKSKHTINIAVLTTHEKSIIEIEDNGIGIDPEYHKDVFNMFFRGASKHAGSGVGLYVAKEAIKKIEGAIQLESTPLIGTKFQIEIPNIVS